MLSLKKVYRDELLQFALILSLLRSHPDAILDNDLYNSTYNLDVDNGTSWRSIAPNLLRNHHVHPKNLDSVLMNYEREIFADLNSLGRYNRADTIRRQDITAYLFDVYRSNSAAEATPAPNENVAGPVELTQEDMDLIEVLWKQDVDLGVPIEPPKSPNPSTSHDDELEKLKVLEELNAGDVKTEPGNYTESDLWAGLDYSVDTETGEYVVKEEPESMFPEFLLEQARQLVERDDDLEASTSGNAMKGSDMDVINSFIEASTFQLPPPLLRTTSVEERWQDLADLLSLPTPSGMSQQDLDYGSDAVRGVLLRNATLTPPMGDIANLAANSSEPTRGIGTTSHVKPTHDPIFYQNATSELNQTDDFLSSVLNDEDLKLMDLAMNEGMYAMSNLSISGACVTRDNSSDSAVSSMGSERVPSLSEGDWIFDGSDSGHNTDSKHRRYSRNSGSFSDASFASSRTLEKGYFQGATVKVEYNDFSSTGPSLYNSSSDGEGAAAQAPEVKYSCSAEFAAQSSFQHNHTYHIPFEHSRTLQRPITRDKTKPRKSEEHLTRDEKRARELNLPITVDDIINLPMDEFNDRLSKYDLTEPQLGLIRDIRRRGKNKVAAQNCRKRKLDQIVTLADEVKEMRDRKVRLLNEHEYLLGEHRRIEDKYQQLYRHVLRNIRDPNGNPYSPHHYSLLTSADGSVLVVPRSTVPEFKDPKGRKE